MENLAPLVTQMLLTATMLAVIVLALTYVVLDSLALPKRTKPLVALIIGLLLGVGAMYIVEMTLPIALWVGGLAGLVASGAYDNAKALLDKNTKKEG